VWKEIRPDFSLEDTGLICLLQNIRGSPLGQQGKKRFFLSEIEKQEKKEVRTRNWGGENSTVRFQSDFSKFQMWEKGQKRRDRGREPGKPTKKLKKC